MAASETGLVQDTKRTPTTPGQNGSLCVLCARTCMVFSDTACAHCARAFDQYVSRTACVITTRTVNERFWFRLMFGVLRNTAGATTSTLPPGFIALGTRSCGSTLHARRQLAPMQRRAGVCTLRCKRVQHDPLTHLGATNRACSVREPLRTVATHTRTLTMAVCAWNVSAGVRHASCWAAEP